MEGIYQNENSSIWEQLYVYHDGIKYPHEDLIKYIHYIDQKKKFKKLKVLDIGFGSYANLEMCYKYGYEISGIEVAKSSLERVQKHFFEKNINFEGKIFQPPNIPFSDEKFSFIYSYEALYYTLEIEKMIREIHRVLEEEGNIFITFFHPEHWYFKYCKRINNNISQWDNHPVKDLNGLMFRMINSETELKSLFNSLFNVEIYLVSSNLLGLEHKYWVVSGVKGEKKEFDFGDYWEDKYRDDK